MKSNFEGDLSAIKDPKPGSFKSTQHWERLERLENESIYILREAYRTLSRPAMLWSMGKDSTVMLWLARKAFFGLIPFPVVHIDTSFKIPEMIEFRGKMAKEWGLDLRISSNREALAEGMNPQRGRLECCTALKTEALKSYLSTSGLRSLFVAIRRDEEGSRAKERIFSPRGESSEWNYKEQAPELWQNYQTDLGEGSEMRVHPLLNWTELDIWLYIREEDIPVLDLYFAREGRRYRSVGCAPCTGSFCSQAQNLDEIVQELSLTREGERVGRAQDNADRYALQKLRSKGYM
ncbi:MAG: sulfate adenylyltransferase subunit CysD [Bdellovibrionales bacterium]|nr:sulfate adenylyltransferase subunit CysD [Bdellovibrionales bacterium]